MIKAIFFDIDGTLVSFRTHTVPESTRKALKQLHEQGVKLFIATGRPKLLINNLDDLEFDGYITLNGAHCFTADYHDIYKGSIPPNDIEQLVSYCKNHDYPFVFVHDNEWFITHVNADVEEISRLIAIPVPPVRPIEEALQTDILQTMGYFKPKPMKRFSDRCFPTANRCAGIRSLQISLPVATVKAEELMKSLPITAFAWKRPWLSVTEETIFQC